jgi:hypothetical protein
MPEPPFVHRLPADVAARIRATAASATGARRTAARVLAVGNTHTLEKSSC